MGLGGFSFDVIPSLFLHLLPGEVEIILCSALWHPEATQFVPCIPWAASPLLGHGEKQIICSLRAKQGRGEERAGAYTRLHGTGCARDSFYRWLVCFAGEAIQKKNKLWGEKGP